MRTSLTPPIWATTAASQTVAYHGCSLSSAQSILASQNPRHSNTSCDWLGPGFYLWDRGPARAAAWANQRSGSEEPAVLAARIELTHCLDLTDVHGTALVANVLAALPRGGIPLPANTGSSHALDHFLVNFACERLEAKGQRIECVRGAFIQGPPLFTGDSGTARLHKQTHIQIAVRNNECITDLWLA